MIHLKKKRFPAIFHSQKFQSIVEIDWSSTTSRDRKCSTTDMRTYLTAVFARGRDSWCWPKGARPLGTWMGEEGWGATPIHKHVTRGDQGLSTREEKEREPGYEVDFVLWWRVLRVLPHLTRSTMAEDFARYEFVQPRFWFLQLGKVGFPVANYPFSRVLFNEIGRAEDSQIVVSE